MNEILERLDRCIVSTTDPVAANDLREIKALLNNLNADHFSKTAVAEFTGQAG